MINILVGQKKIDMIEVKEEESKRERKVLNSCYICMHIKF